MPFFKLNKDLILLLIIFSGFIGLASCETNDPGCYEPISVTGMCGFQKRDTQMVNDTVSTNPLVVLSEVKYIFNDSLMNAPEMKLLNENIAIVALGAKGAKTLGIAFNQAKDSVRYTFRTDTAAQVYDTITIHYNSTLHFISNNCGYNYFYGIQKVKHTTNMLDSFSIINPEVTDAAKINVLFYFKRKF